MNKITRAFADSKVLIPFVTCGDPTLDTTKEIVKELVKKGISVFELGIPFSDPAGESPVAQEANTRALANGVTTDKIFDMVNDLTKELDITVVFRAYANVVFGYGTEKFLQRCQKAGVNGLILLDVPYEEKGEFEGLCKKYGVALILVVAPTSGNRIRKIAKEAEGYLYCLGSLGPVSEDVVKTNVQEMVLIAKDENPALPCVVGLGHASPKLVKDVLMVSDGVSLAEDIVRIVAKEGKGSAATVRKFVESLLD